eukprot:CAMPEP_0206430312 /NCGR_PEP_ID=MMETSP0324_2-20121206/6745_1 /ASSEMBLY_ACC=CAM_ASM_000836 /TAXON_ID=2866 /ORGANISM="Crypthecodinium cohnii, Strain Seligo" /LENGTH=108 /DNA_ID=CAMNT_0053896127 /DNA_START=71 /DNA_END=393 /DNA_ORIENTATION=-
MASLMPAWWCCREEQTVAQAPSKVSAVDPWAEEAVAEKLDEATGCCSCRSASTATSSYDSRGRKKETHFRCVSLDDDEDDCCHELEHVAALAPAAAAAAATAAAAAAA